MTGTPVVEYRLEVLHPGGLISRIVQDIDHQGFHLGFTVYRPVLKLGKLIGVRRSRWLLADAYKLATQPSILKCKKPGA